MARRAGELLAAIAERVGSALWSRVAAGLHLGHFGTKRIDGWPGWEAGQPVGLPEGQQPLSLVGPGVHRRSRLGLPEVDAVLVTARADLGALRSVGSPGDIGQGHIKVAGERVLHVRRFSGRLRMPELALGLLRRGEQLIEVSGERHVSEVTGLGSGADAGATLFHAA